MQNMLVDGQKRSTIKDASMEKALLNKIHNRTMDEIDKEMVTARCKNACDHIFGVASECIDKLNNVCEEFSDEVRLMGISIVFSGQVKALHRTEEETDCGLIIGTSKNISAILDNIRGQLK